MPTTVSEFGWPSPTGDDYANGPAQFRAALAAVAATLANTYLTRAQAAALFAPAASGTTTSTLTGTAASATDVPLTARGATNQTADLAQFRNAVGTVLARVTAAGRLVQPVEARRVLAYDGAGNLASVSVTNAAGTQTLSTSTLTYDAAGNLASVTDVANSATRTRTLSYDGTGNLVLVTEVES